MRSSCERWSIEAGSHPARTRGGHAGTSSPSSASCSSRWGCARSGSSRPASLSSNSASTSRGRAASAPHRRAHRSSRRLSFQRPGQAPRGRRAHQRGPARHHLHSRGPRHSRGRRRTVRAARSDRRRIGRAAGAGGRRWRFSAITTRGSTTTACAAPSEQAGIRVLEDTAVRVETPAGPVWVAGVSDLWTRRHDIKAALSGVQPRGARSAAHPQPGHLSRCPGSRVADARGPYARRPGALPVRGRAGRAVPLSSAFRRGACGRGGPASVRRDRHRDEHSARALQGPSSRSTLDGRRPAGASQVTASDR